MRVFSALFICLSLVVAVTFASPRAYAVSYTVGVSAGNWAKYTVLGGWNTTEPLVDMPNFVRDARNTDWIQINVTTVSSTSVTILVVTQFQNGSRKPNINIGDVRTGSGNLSLQLIAANLGEGDKLSLADGALTVNKTVTKTYAKAVRTVSYAYNEEFAPRGENEEESAVYEFYWDKASGIISAMSLVQVFESQNYRTIASIIMEIKETNIWQPEVKTGFGAEWVIAAFISATGIVIAVFIAVREARAGNRRRRSKVTTRQRRASRILQRTDQNAT